MRPPGEPGDIHGVHMHDSSRLPNLLNFEWQEESCEIVLFPKQNWCCVDDLAYTTLGSLPLILSVN